MILTLCCTNLLPALLDSARTHAVFHLRIQAKAFIDFYCLGRRLFPCDLACEQKDDRFQDRPGRMSTVIADADHPRGPPAPDRVRQADIRIETGHKLPGAKGTGKCRQDGMTDFLK